MTIEERSCKSKQRYQDKKKAKAAMLGMVQCYGLHKAIFHVYPCVFCRGWHVGHRRPDIDKKRHEQEAWASGAYF